MTETEKEYKTRNQTWILLKARGIWDHVGGEIVLEIWMPLVRKLHVILKYVQIFKGNLITPFL